MLESKINFDINQFINTAFFLPAVCFMGVIGGLLSCSLLEIPILTAIGLWPKENYKKVFFKLLAFVSGFLLNYLILSLFLGQISLFFAKNMLLLSILLFFSGLICIFWGIVIILLKLDLKPLQKVVKFIYPQNYIYIFILGFLFVFLELTICPSCRPILYVLSEIVFPTGNLFFIIITFLIYGFGRIIPILLISFLLLYLLEHPILSKSNEPIRIFLGSLLIFIGLIFIWLI
jgi:hypothetical protein